MDCFVFRFCPPPFCVPFLKGRSHILWEGIWEVPNECEAEGLIAREKIFYVIHIFLYFHVIPEKSRFHLAPGTNVPGCIDFFAKIYILHNIFIYYLIVVWKKLIC